MKRIFEISLLLLLALTIGCGKSKAVVAEEKKFQLPIVYHSRSVKCFVDKNGKLYTWGLDLYLNEESSANQSGFIKDTSSLGQGSNILYNNIPKSIYPNVKMLEGTRAITWDHKMVEWGFRADKKATTPKMVREDVSFIFNSCYITSSGELYSFKILDYELEQFHHKRARYPEPGGTNYGLVRSASHRNWPYFESRATNC